MSVKGKTIEISFPNFIQAFNIFAYRMWTIKFKCGKCDADPIVQHDEAKNYHKCPVCKEINILDKTSYFD